MRLLPFGALIRTGAVDHADWNYRPILGYVSRQRFSLVASLLSPERTGALLEIGYGSGIFMPELAAHTKRLAGCDIHSQYAPVSAALVGLGVDAELVQIDGVHLPFNNGDFDVIVAVSALEFIENLPAACREFQRVMAPNGRLIVVMPGRSRILDFALRVLTHESAERDYGERRRFVIPTLRQFFSLDRQVTFPAVLGACLPVYTALRFRRLA